MEKEFAKIGNVEKLEAGKQGKPQETEDAIKSVQESAQVEQLSPKDTETGSEEVKVKWQAVQEMQVQLAEKRHTIGTVLEEIKQGMQFVKELQTRGSNNEKDAMRQVKALQGKMKERKEALEETIREMEELGANMRGIQIQPHN